MQAHFKENLLIIMLGMNVRVSAEIVLDGTLGPAKVLSGPNFAVEADLGQQVGNNLFHSFQNFNLLLGESATFSGSDTVNHIISRVTGGEISLIDGELKSTIPKADMYFLNPAGIVFGPHARLDIQGSLYTSTADYLRLGELGRFDATHPAHSELTVAPPSAFGFLDDSPASMLQDKSVLQLPAEKTFAFIGGNLTLQDNDLKVPDGQVNLISVASSGEVPIEPNTLSENAFDKWGSITITDSTEGTANFDRTRANINASGIGGGRVLLQGGQIKLDNGYVFADTDGEKNGQGITVKATEKLVLERASRITSGHDPRKIEQATGNLGNITVAAGQIRLSEGSQLASTALTTGAAGHISITAKDAIEITGHFSGTFQGHPFSFSSGLLSDTHGTGTGGQITVSTPSLTLANHSTIRAGSKIGLGDAGKITLQVNTLTLKEGARIDVSTGNINYQSTTPSNVGTGGSIKVIAKQGTLITDAPNDESSGLFSNTFSRGDGGTITVSTPRLEIQNGGTIQAGTQSNSNGGQIFLEVGILHINNGFISTLTENSSSKIFEGHAGNIHINASQAVIIEKPHLKVQGNISSSTRSNGEAGHIVITTPKLALYHQGKINSITATSSKGGNIIINAGYVHLNNGEITVKSFGKGDAGELAFIIDSLRMQADSSITTAAETANGGDINISSPGYLYLTDSDMTTSVRGEEGSGGNMTLKPVFIVLDNSHIKANAFEGDGGHIRITTTGIYNLSGEAIDQVITASSTLGRNGEIVVDSPEVNLEEDLVILPATFIDASKLLKSCELRQVDQTSHFFIYKLRKNPLSQFDLKPSRLLWPSPVTEVNLPPIQNNLNPTDRVIGIAQLF